MVKIVNVVGSGDLGVELDLEELANDVEFADFDPDGQQQLFLKFGEGTPLIIVYRTGKFIIRGGGSHERLFQAHGNLLDLLAEMDIISSGEQTTFDVKNVVCVGNLERTVDLNKLVLVLGMESTEYEPEQFPGLVYRPDNSDVTLLVFGSGKVVLTGSSEVENAEAALESLKSELVALERVE
jgi:transcription initiation factor TFIID TATA-box-binding protein